MGAVVGVGAQGGQAVRALGESSRAQRMQRICGRCVTKKRQVRAVHVLTEVGQVREGGVASTKWTGVVLRQAGARVILMLGAAAHAAERPRRGTAKSECGGARAAVGHAMQRQAAARSPVHRLTAQGTEGHLLFQSDLLCARGTPWPRSGGGRTGSGRFWTRVQLLAGRLERAHIGNSSELVLTIKREPHFEAPGAPSRGGGGGRSGRGGGRRGDGGG